MASRDVSRGNILIFGLEIFTSDSQIPDLGLEMSGPNLLSQLTSCEAIINNIRRESFKSYITILVSSVIQYLNII
jgi:hypothetical protein